MKLSYICIMTLCLWLAECGKLFKKHVYNSIEPLPDIDPIYNISVWVRQLHLQQCVIVEIGEKYCAVFVENRISNNVENSSDVEEYFLGVCDSDTLRKWRYCPVELERERTKECIFQEFTQFSKYPARVHRRLCDVTGLSYHGNSCDCTKTLGGKPLYEVTGFPTCFISPLPNSICIPRNVCGIFSCNASTINQKVHSVKCSSHCLYKQPFCESLFHESSKPSDISSYWSDWREPFDNSYHNDHLRDAGNLVISEAICINKNTGLGSIDCLGPGTNCCPTDAEKCKCSTFLEDGILKLTRQYFLIRDTLELEKREINNDKYQTFNFKHPYLLAKYENSRQNNITKRKEDEEYEDDSENDDDNKEEDIVFEDDDDNDKKIVSSTEDVEKNEIKSIIIEEMKTSIDIFQNEEKILTTNKQTEYRQVKSADPEIRINRKYFVCFLLFFL